MTSPTDSGNTVVPGYMAYCRIQPLSRKYRLNCCTLYQGPAMPAGGFMYLSTAVASAAETQPGWSTGMPAACRLRETNEVHGLLPEVLSGSAVRAFVLAQAPAASGLNE